MQQQARPAGSIFIQDCRMVAELCEEFLQQATALDLIDDDGG